MIKLQIKQGVSVRRLFQRKCRAPNFTGTLPVFEEFVKTGKRIHVGEHKVDRKSRARQLYCLVQTSPQGLGLLFDLGVVCLEHTARIYRQQETVEGAGVAI